MKVSSCCKVSRRSKRDETDIIAMTCQVGQKAPYKLNIISEWYVLHQKHKYGKTQFTIICKHGILKILHFRRKSTLDMRMPYSITCPEESSQDPAEQESPHHSLRLRSEPSLEQTRSSPVVRPYHSPTAPKSCAKLFKSKNKLTIIDCIFSCK